VVMSVGDCSQGACPT